MSSNTPSISEKIIPILKAHIPNKNASFEDVQKSLPFTKEEDLKEKQIAISCARLLFDLFHNNPRRVAFFEDLIGSAEKFQKKAPPDLNIIAFYNHAKFICHHPFELHLKYEIFPKIQNWVVKHPLATFSMEALLLGCFFNSLTLLMGFFLGSLYYFKSDPSSARQTGEFLFSMLRHAFYLEAFNQLIFPLSLFLIAPDALPFPIESLALILGLWATQRFIDLETQMNVLAFEEKQGISPHASKALANAHCQKETYNSFKYPLTHSLCFNACLFLLPSAYFLEIKRIARLIHFFSIGFGLLSSKPERKAFFALMGLYQLCSQDFAALSTWFQTACHDFKIQQVYGIPLLTLPSEGPYCHEESGSVWEIDLANGIRRYFTVDSVFRNYSLISIQSTGLKDSKALMPFMPEVSDPIKSLCDLSGTCQNRLNAFVFSLPIHIASSKNPTPFPIRWISGLEHFTPETPIILMSFLSELYKEYKRQDPCHRKKRPNRACEIS